MPLGNGHFDHIPGALYDDLKRFERKAPEQEWNRLTIVAKNIDFKFGNETIPGSAIEWHVNGEKLGSANVGRPAGHIFLEGSIPEGAVELRAIRIRDLDIP